MSLILTKSPGLFLTIVRDLKNFQPGTSRDSQFAFWTIVSSNGFVMSGWGSEDIYQSINVFH